MKLSELEIPFKIGDKIERKDGGKTGILTGFKDDNPDKFVLDTSLPGGWLDKKKAKINFKKLRFANTLELIYYNETFDYYYNAFGTRGGADAALNAKPITIRSVDSHNNIIANELGDRKWAIQHFVAAEQAPLDPNEFSLRLNAKSITFGGEQGFAVPNEVLDHLHKIKEEILQKTYLTGELLMTKLRVLHSDHYYPKLEINLNDVTYSIKGGISLGYMSFWKGDNRIIKGETTGSFCFLVKPLKAKKGTPNEGKVNISSTSPSGYYIPKGSISGADRYMWIGGEADELAPYPQKVEKPVENPFGDGGWPTPDVLDALPGIWKDLAYDMKAEGCSYAEFLAEQQNQLDMDVDIDELDDDDLPLDLND